MSKQGTSRRCRKRNGNKNSKKLKSSLLRIQRILSKSSENLSLAQEIGQEVVKKTLAKHTDHCSLLGNMRRENIQIFVRNLNQDLICIRPSYRHKRFLKSSLSLNKSFGDGKVTPFGGTAILPQHKDAINPGEINDASPLPRPMEVRSLKSWHKKEPQSKEISGEI